MIPEIYLTTAERMFSDLVSFEFSNGLIKNWNQTSPTFPPMNIVEDKNKKFIELKMAIAGFSKDEIKVESEDEYLTISGEKKEAFDNYEENSVRFIKKNLNNVKFSRTFSFSDNYYNFRNPKVSLKDGLLTIKIEKNPELISEKKEITIE